MRNLSADALAKITTQYGTEPICVVGVKWFFGSDYTYYSDKGMPEAPPKVLSIANLEDVVILQGSSNATNMSITLDDTDGTLKEIFNATDIHRRPAAIFQTFDGLNFSDKFILYEGFIESPIVWSDGDRTLTFSLTSITEHIEIGFSPEEGQFPGLPTSDVGVVWPLAFGDARHVPGLTYQVTPIGTTLNPFYYVNSNLDVIDPSTISTPGAITYSAQSVYFDGNQPTDTDDPIANSINQSINELADAFDSRPDPGTITFMINGQEYDAHDYMLVKTTAGASITQLPQPNQSAYANLPQVAAQLKLKGASTVGVQLLNNGYGFPVGVPLTLSMNNHVFHGTMSSTGFMTLKELVLPKATFAYRPPQAPLQPGENVREYDFQLQQAATYFTPDGSFTPAEYKAMGTPKFNSAGEAPVGYTLVTGLQSDGFQLYDAGSSITIMGDNSIDYIVNTVPTTITQVYGYRAIGNVKTLSPVPASRWKHVSVDFNGITAEIVRLNRPLTGYPGEGWDDGIYVDEISSIGPNPADIISYVVFTYAPDLNIDFTSFNEVHGFLQNYPMNFVYNNRVDIISFISDIAYQARCAVYVKNFTVFIRYLPQERDGDATITYDDIIEGSLEITTTETEQLVTRSTGTYVGDYATGIQDDVVVRSNIFKYGIFRDSYDYFAYTEAQYVLKSVTYWIIQKSNVWKRIKFSTNLNRLNLETYDTVVLDLQDHQLALGTVTCRIESTQYDSVNNKIDFECWTPVRAGEMLQYAFAYPQNISTTLFYPTYFADYQANVYQDFRQDVLGAIATLPAQQSNSAGNGQYDSNAGGGAADGNNEQDNPSAQDQQNGYYSQYDGTWHPGTLPGTENPPGAPENQTVDPDGIRTTTSMGSQNPSDLVDLPPIPRPQDTSVIPDPIQIDAEEPTDPTAVQPTQQIRMLQTPPPAMCPGIIQGGSGDSYQVGIYINGLDHKITQVSVKQLQIDPTEIIPIGTWCMVSRITLARKASGDGVAINFVWDHIHYMQVPVWLA